MFPSVLELYRLYNSLLYIGSISNIILAIILLIRVLHSKFYPYRNYQRSGFLMALSIAVFGAGFLLHAIYQPRIVYPALASTLSISYTHIAAVLFAFSYTSLLNPNYIKPRMVACHVTTVVIGQIAYWLPFTYTTEPSAWWKACYLICFIHVLILIWQFYSTYHEVKNSENTNTTRYLVPFAKSIRWTSYAIACMAVVSCSMYAIFTESLAIYIISVAFAYFLLFFVFKAILSCGKIIIDTNGNDKNTTTIQNTKSKLFRYNITAHTIVYILSIVIIYMLTHGSKYTLYDEDKSLPSLNLTKNALWDFPKMDGTQTADLRNMISRSPDSLYLKLTLSLHSDTVRHEYADSICRIIDKMPESYFKGALQMSCLNDLFKTIPHKDLTPQQIHQFLEKGFKIAGGKNPVPMVRFFTFWNNCMIGYSSNQQTDSVNNEASRFLKICRQQNIPIGVMYAYTALGYCLMDASDFQGASEHFDTALQMAEGYYPDLLGTDWLQEKESRESDLVENYLHILSLNARCHLEASDTLWLKDREQELLEVLDLTERNTTKINILYSLAIYNDKWADKEKYPGLVAQLEECLKEDGSRNSTDEKVKLSYGNTLYKTVLVRHELRNRHGDKAMALINTMPEHFTDTTMTYYPDALLQQGRYEEAAKRYKKTVDFYYHLLNGRNRYLLHSLSVNVSEENKNMQLMEVQLQNQQTQLMYNSLLMLVLIVMIGGLGYFLYRQRRLNKNLNEALELAEKASNAKNLFLKNMRHEVNTPLNAIYGFAQILADRDYPIDEEMTRPMADAIVEGSENLIHLLDNIVEATDKLSKLDHLEDVESILKNDNIRK